MANKKSKKQSVATESIGFSSKGKKKPAPVAVTTVQKDKLTKKQIIALIAITMVALLISATIIGAVAASKTAKTVDFMSSNLSKYISISEDDYKNYIINVPLDYYSDADLEREINSLRTSKKTENETYKGGYVKLEPLTLGDEAYIYYRGYTVGSDGREVDFEGSSNFASEDMTILEVGTGKVFVDGEHKSSFIPGFAEALLGKTPADYEPFRKIKEGSVSAGDVVYLSYTVMGEGGNKVAQNERIDLSLPYINEIYGAGFVEFLLGKTIGVSITDKFIVRMEGHSTDTTYSDMKIEFATRCESNPLTISVRFPANYSKEELRGVDAYFDVYIEYAAVYDVPEFNDEFITKSLEVNERYLSGYSGASLTEKYTAKLKAEIEKELEDSNHAILEAAMFKHLLTKVEVIKLPTSYVDNYIEACVSDLESTYESYKSSFSSIEEYARAAYGYSSEITYQDYFRTEAERAITEKLVFYYIIREEKLLPTESEFNTIKEALYNDILNYYLELHKDEFMKFTDEEYAKELATLKDEISSYYGEEYFEENVYYYYGTRKMLDFCMMAK